MVDPDISRLLEGVQAGDEEAAAELWEACSGKLLHYAKKKLAGMPLRAVDEEDVVLSAMNSFLLGAREGRLQPQNRNELWKLLATITVRKANAKLRMHHAEKRGQGKVRGESVFIRKQGSDEQGDGLAQVMDQEHLPELTDRLLQMCEERLGALEDDSLRQVAILRLQGYRQEEIANELNCSRATIKRRIAKIRAAWTEE